MSIPVATRIPTIIATRFLKIIRKWVAKVIKTVKEAVDLHKDFVNL
jgi:hypothetical protein